LNNNNNNNNSNNNNKVNSTNLWCSWLYNYHYPS